MSTKVPTTNPAAVVRVIREVRGHRVILDADAAALYGVPTKALVQAVKRNEARFPADFMFRLTSEEAAEVNRSQTVTGSQKHRNPRVPPLAFTEYRVAMLSSVLRSERAILVNIEIMRAFGRLRLEVGAHADLVRRLDALEAKYDRRFRQVFDAIRMLIVGQAKLSARVKRLEQPPPPNLRRIR